MLYEWPIAGGLKLYNLCLSLLIDVVSIWLDGEVDESNI